MMKAGLCAVAMFVALAACANAQTAQAPAPAPATSAPTTATDQGPCGFSTVTLAFRGDARTQARCLLRHVARFGVLEDELPLPPSLDAIVGARIALTPAQLRAYLARQGIAEADIGGALTDPVSRTENGSPAAYFVIHDTSTPNMLAQPFPADRDEASWRHNNVAVWQRGDQSVAHVFIGRTGSSVTAVDFSRGWRATKLESRVAGAASRGRFLHVENVQPRRSLEGGAPGNDNIGPEPGFSDAQLRRLALVYVAASVRAGVWLIPAQHAAIDSGIPNGHDDPQNFDLARWDGFVAETIAAIAP